MESIIFLGWLIAGFGAYGLAKGTWRNFYEEYWEFFKKGGYNFLRHDYFKEFSCWLYGILGPIGLALVIFSIESGPKAWRLCYRMPEKYWYKKYGDE